MEKLIISPSGGGGGGVFCESTRKKWKNNSDGRRADDRSPDASLDGWIMKKKKLYFPIRAWNNTGRLFFLERDDDGGGGGIGSGKTLRNVFLPTSTKQTTQMSGL